MEIDISKMEIDVGEVRTRYVNRYFDEIIENGYTKKAECFRDAIKRLDEDMKYFFKLKFNPETLRYE